WRWRRVVRRLAVLWGIGRRSRHESRRRGRLFYCRRNDGRLGRLDRLQAGIVGGAGREQHEAHAQDENRLAHQAYRTTLCRGEHPFALPHREPPLTYSYRRDSIGFKREALFAG